MVDGPVTNRRFSRRAIRKAITISVSVLVVFVVVGGGWVLYSKMSASSEKAAREAKELMARDIATQAQKSLLLVKDKLTALAKDPQTLSLFEEGAEDAALLAYSRRKTTLVRTRFKVTLSETRFV